jgi:hypothetical protein
MPRSILDPSVSTAEANAIIRSATEYFMRTPASERKESSISLDYIKGGGGTIIGKYEIHVVPTLGFRYPKTQKFYFEFQKQRRDTWVMHGEDCIALAKFNKKIITLTNLDLVRSVSLCS